MNEWPDRHADWDSCRRDECSMIAVHAIRFQMSQDMSAGEKVVQ